MIIVFDLDGTLIDSELRHRILLEKLLKQYEIHYKNNLEGYLDYKKSGNGNMKFLREILKLDKKTAYDLQEKWIEQIENLEYLKYDEIYEDVIPTLSKLNKENEIYYLTARSNKQNLMEELKYLQIQEYAKDILIVSPKKPIEEKRTALIKFDKDKKIILVGDTEIEYEAGKQLSNIDTKILNRGFRNKKFFENKKIKSYDNLYEIFEEVKDEKR